MDTVFIRELRIDTIIGIFDWERTTRQSVVLDIEMASDNRRAAGTDHINDALNYADVAQRLISFIENSEFQLVETMAEAVAALILEEFNVPWLRLRIAKPGAIAGARDVGVVIERGEHP
ncbi:MAG: dihydroneopterin aldolase [Halieaceae bacterium]|jgi:7,8-dihydroneopterin aldolase/epimerase/oxygenase|nr:dihydroneopterin aldolase [Halieaceae bacterium]